MIVLYVKYTVSQKKRLNLETV